MDQRMTAAVALLSSAHGDLARSESLQAIRTEILLRRETPQRAEVIAVISAGATEGRSTLAAELAIAFAEAGHATLLVDADLRQPCQHELFNLPNQLGLAQLLMFGNRPLLHVPPGLPQLTVMTAGDRPARPLDLLSHPAFAEAISAWRDQYRVVVIDTPALGQWPDGAAIANVAGRALLATRSGHTRYTELRTALRRLAPTRSRVMGAVINHF
jgi:receptor protein-tyrosine kinase